jgi:hypothetical protein
MMVNPVMLAAGKSGEVPGIEKLMMRFVPAVGTLASVGIGPLAVETAIIPFSLDETGIVPKKVL